MRPAVAQPPRQSPIDGVALTDVSPQTSHSKATVLAHRNSPSLWRNPVAQLSHLYGETTGPVGGLVTFTYEPRFASARRFPRSFNMADYFLDQRIRITAATKWRSADDHGGYTYAQNLCVERSEQVCGALWR